MSATTLLSTKSLALCRGRSVNLVVLDGLGERLHADRFIQLVSMQQVDQEVQGALVHAHLRVQRAHLFVDVHAALRQSPDVHGHTHRLQFQFKWISCGTI